MMSDGWHDQPLNEVVEDLAPNILVQFLSRLNHGTNYKSSQYPIQLSAICAASINQLCQVADLIH